MSNRRHGKGTKQEERRQVPTSEDARASWPHPALRGGGEGDAEQREPGVGAERTRGGGSAVEPCTCPDLRRGRGAHPLLSLRGSRPWCSQQGGKLQGHRGTGGLWPRSSLSTSFCFQRVAALGHRVTKRLKQTTATASAATAEPVLTPCRTPAHTQSQPPRRARGSHS